jgi:hypothetical protein
VTAFGACKLVAADVASPGGPSPLVARSASQHPLTAHNVNGTDTPNLRTTSTANVYRPWPTAILLVDNRFAADLDRATPPID